ncbi:hypothetical protein CDAR_535841 [Caerostris darwini]|uniref:Uncharacterized protein n=1 Tax=Caerostris darwini TaxID=1538125 RepID=A0AAV4QTI4_9ARAC|nr:hypothetical protein CDAR_535841 [Caerostris darwini]
MSLNVQCPPPLHVIGTRRITEEFSKKSHETFPRWPPPHPIRHGPALRKVLFLDRAPHLERPAGNQAEKRSKNFLSSLSVLEVTDTVNFIHIRYSPSFLHIDYSPRILQVCGLILVLGLSPCFLHIHYSPSLMAYASSPF